MYVWTKLDIECTSVGLTHTCPTSGMQGIMGRARVRHTQLNTVSNVWISDYGYNIGTEFTG